MKKQVFIINGSGGVGKDTLIELIAEYSGFSIMNFSSVDKVKEVARMIGWDGGKTEKDRKFLSDLKLLCSEYNDMPFKSMDSTVNVFHNSDALMLFLHIREPEEIERAKNEFGAMTVLVKRDAVKHITSNMADGRVFNYAYDIIIDNDRDIDAFRKKAQSFVNDFISGSILKYY